MYVDRIKENNNQVDPAFVLFKSLILHYKPKLVSTTKKKTNPVRRIYFADGNRILYCAKIKEEIYL